MEGAISNNEYNTPRVNQNITLIESTEVGRRTSIIDDESFVYEEEDYEDQLNPTSFIGKLLLSLA